MSMMFDQSYHVDKLVKLIKTKKDIPIILEVLRPQLHGLKLLRNKKI